MKNVKNIKDYAYLQKVEIYVVVVKYARSWQECYFLCGEKFAKKVKKIKKMAIEYFIFRRNTRVI